VFELIALRRLNNDSNRLKKLDPWHVVIGAIESIDMFVFETKNIFVPEASLDVPMLENYVGYVAQNAGRGTAFGEPGGDGSIRAYPMTYATSHVAQSCTPPQCHT